MSENLALNLTRTAAEHPDAIACKLDDAAFGYGLLDQASARVAAMLKSKGVRTGDRVGIAVRAGTRVVVDAGRGYRRTVRLRRGLAVLTLPSGRPLRAVTFIRKGRGHRVRIDAPPGARHCGWHFARATP